MQNDPNEALLSKPQTKAGQLQRAVLELLHEHHDRGELPTSNRSCSTNSSRPLHG